MSKILTVFGATGNQGGSVAATVLRHPELSKMYKVRAVTRDASKASAQRLRDQGAEVVEADLSDAGSVRAAVRGAHAVFGVTNAWGLDDGESEAAQGRALADAVAAEGVEFFVFSSLPHVGRLSAGRLTHVAHFDEKADVEAYARSLPVRCAFYWPAFFMSNFLRDFLPRRNDGDDSFTLAQPWRPDSRFPVVDIADTGKFVEPLLLDPEKWDQKRMYAADAFYTPEELVATWSKVAGKKITYKQIPDDEWKGYLPPAIGTELLENMILMREYKYYGPEGKGAEAEVKDSLAALSEKPTTWEEFLKKQNWAELLQ